MFLTCSDRFVSTSIFFFTEKSITCEEKYFSSHVRKIFHTLLLKSHLEKDSAISTHRSQKCNSRKTFLTASLDNYSNKIPLNFTVTPKHLILYLLFYMIGIEENLDTQFELPCSRSVRIWHDVFASIQVCKTTKDLTSM